MPTKNNLQKRRKDFGSDKQELRKFIERRQKLHEMPMCRLNENYINWKFASMQSNEECQK